MIFLNAFEVITGPFQYVTYLVMGFGLGLVVVPRKVPKQLVRDEPTT